MKNQYFGDINDYRKYGLLRCLHYATALPIGVCWMVTEGDGRRDGERRRYLDEPENWRGFDATLYQELGRARSRPTRDVRDARTCGLVPGARYFEVTLEDGLEARSSYFEAAMRELRDCSLLFFDPDNGIEVRSVARGAWRSAKYVYWCELETAFREGHSLLVYQHFPRVKRGPFVELLVGAIRDRISPGAVLSFRTANVVFFLALRPEHADRVAAALDLVTRRWNGQISAVAHPRALP